MRIALARTLQASTVPYGYTLTIWSTGAVLMATLGPPPVLAAVLFVMGAVAAYSVLSALSHSDFGDSSSDRQGYRNIGRFHWLPIAISIGVTALLTRVACWWAWPLASFASTGIYVLAASSHWALIERRGGDLQR